MLGRSALAIAVLGVAGCSGNLFVGSLTTGGVPANAGASSGGTSPSAGRSDGTAGTSGGSGSSGGSNATVGSASVGDTAGNGSTSGGAFYETLGPIDGGYVFCEIPAQHAPGEDAGWQQWMCQPDTYVCDPTHPNDCVQCRNDADCTNFALPTFDPYRPRCDLDSGISGYQGFCQQCLGNSDCARKGAATACDLNPSHREPSIVDVGFETCTCVSDGGDVCPAPRCDPATCPLGAACTSDLGCGFSKPHCVDGGCFQCRDNGDCTHEYGVGGCVNGYCTTSVLCTSDSDCIGVVYAPSCLTNESPPFFCGCSHDDDCTGNPDGPRCDQSLASTTRGLCGCQSAKLDCDAGQTCQALTHIHTCTNSCDNGQCPPGYSCDPTSVCRPRCDPGHTCTSGQPVCDVNDRAKRNFNGVTWCYQCLVALDCPAGQACSQNQECGPCNAAAPCPSGQICGADLACHTDCTSLECPVGQVCDVLDLQGEGLLCFQCITAGDCPGHQGCDDRTHICGTCESPEFQPNASPTGLFPQPGVLDCRPGDVCSNAWSNAQVKSSTTGVCLQNCDLPACPDPSDLCKEVPSLTTDHRYCVGCLQDSDCPDAGFGSWCDVSVDFTFQCRSGAFRGQHQRPDSP